ncbi:MAG: endonuclease [Salinibacter sp.]
MNWTRWWLAGLVVFVAAAVGAPAQAQQSIYEARQEGAGAEVTVEGTVTRAFGDFVRLQDDSGPNGASGLVVRQTSGEFYDDVQDGTIAKGTQLEVSGTLSEFNGLLQINEDDLSDYTGQGDGSVPDPQSVTLETLAAEGEDYESVLVEVAGLSVQGAEGTFENQTSYTVTDETETFTFRVQDTGETEIGGTPIPEGSFDYTGVVGEFSGEYQLIPVRESDLQSSLSFAFNRLFARAEEGGESVSVQVQVFNKETDEDVSVTAEVGPASTAENGTDVTGFDSPQTLTFSGTDPAPQTLTFEPVDDGEQEGVERLEVVLSSDDGAISAPDRFTLWILDNPTAQAPLVEGDSSQGLLDSLRQRYGNPPTIGYDAARDSLYRSILNDEGTVETIYSGFQAEADPAGDATAQLLDQDVNTEHLWPRSKGPEEEPALSNMYILAPAWEEANSYRCNYPYAEIEDADAERWIREKTVQSSPPSTERETYTESVGNTCGSPSDNGEFEPRHSKKGDVARAAFYFAMAYPNRADLSFLESQRETLLEWHREDPVDATELRRSLAKAAYQGNRVNPFILDSTLADRAYGAGVPGPGVVAIEDAREQGAGQTVTVEGVVTRVGPEGPYLQDDTGALYVFETGGSFGQNLGGTIREGTRLEVTGTLEFYNGLLEVTDVPEDGYEIRSQDNPLPEASALSLGDIAQDGDAYESEIVRVEDFAIEAGGDEQFQDDTNYTISDNSDELVLRVPEGADLAGEEIPDRATFQGVLGQFNDAGAGADEPDEGYQLLGLTPDDVEAELPQETAVDVTRSFDDPGTGDSYRLVALPGQVDRALASTLSEDAGVGWQAYWDNGSEEDFFVKFDGSDQFNFRPGRGFWLLSTGDWSVKDTFSTVEVTDGETTIPLHEGWNIISNPLPVDVSWTDVEAANGGALQALWAWTDGIFDTASTFTSATEGRAFYFLNDQGLDQLTIPVASETSGASRTEAAASPSRPVTLRAHRGSDTAAVRVEERADAQEGRDRHDLVGPPSRFSALSLRSRIRSSGDTPERQQALARDVRPEGTDGQTYDLTLRADTTGSVTLRADDLPRTDAVVLLDSAGTRYDLRERQSVSLSAGPTPTSLQLLVGDQSYVESEAVEQLPNQLSVEDPRPNPFRDRVTLRYTLPSAQEVQVAVYDVLGREVQTLVEGRKEAGAHRTTWDGKDRDGGTFASGVYFVRWTTDETQHTERVLLVR